MNQPDDDEEYRLKKVREARLEKQRTRSYFNFGPVGCKSRESHDLTLNKTIGNRTRERTSIIVRNIEIETKGISRSCSRLNITHVKIFLLHKNINPKILFRNDTQGS